MSPTIQGCRACGDTRLETVLDFGDSPLADQLVDASELDSDDLIFPLRLVFCPACALVQITETVPAEILWGGDYPYYTSVSPGLVKHFSSSAEALMARLSLDENSLVIEAASNDGHMLKVFAERGIGVLGVDPAEGPARAAEEAGVPTLCRLFDLELARELAAEGKRADLLLGNNVLNLVPQPGDFLEATDLLLSENGEVVLEVPYLVDSIDQTAFDNVFHQNTTYWSLTSVERLFRRRNFFLNDVERVATFGGSLRLTFARRQDESEAVRSFRAEEQRRGVDTFAFYAEFASRVETIKARLAEMLRGLAAEGKRIACYGAAGGMATTLLAYIDFEPGLIEYAVDISRHKHGRYTSGSRLLIHPPDKLLEDKPDCVLLLAWNFAEEVMQQNQAFREAGGRFLVPVPEPRLV